MIDVRVSAFHCSDATTLTQELNTASESYASVCSFVLCDSGTFLKFWLDDHCRDRLLSYVPKPDLASLRLACHDFSVRAAPALFNDLIITFRTSTFTKPARLAALDRLGFYVKTLSFHLPHSAETFLPPLVEPDTGAELSFTYTPQIQTSRKQAKYGDCGTTEILTRQYPALFHAATNVPAFVRALSAFVNLAHLKIGCPGYDATTAYRRSVVDYALISLRIAVEQNCLNALDTLTLSPIHPGALLYLSPIIGYGATPRSASRWSRIQHLSIHSTAMPGRPGRGDLDHSKLLQTYLRNFQANLTTFDFRWEGEKGALPLQRPIMSAAACGTHPAECVVGDGSHPLLCRSKGLKPLHFPKLRRLEVENVKTSADEVRAFVEAHKHTIEDVDLAAVELVSGTWDEALASFTTQARPRLISAEAADIPIMLSPTAARPLAAPIAPVDVAHEKTGRRSLRLSRWLPSKGSKPMAEQLRRLIRAGVMPWR